MVHKDKNHFKCDACDKSFSENSVLSVHLKKDHGNKPYQCKVCGKTFKSSLGSEIHMKKHNIRGRDWCKKIDWLKILPLVKDPQFLSNQADIQAIFSIHELVILTKFHKDWQEIVDFLVIAKFWASPIFFASVSIVFWAGPPSDGDLNRST